MKKQHVTLPPALQSDAEFLAFLTQAAQSESYRQIREHPDQTVHPTGAQLYDYVLMEGTPNERRWLHAHLVGCAACAQEVARIERIETELDQELLAWSDLPLPPPKGEDIPAKGDLPLPVPKRAEIPALADRFIQWLSELWEPQWAGELVTAANVPEQAHIFSTAQGDIKIGCYWQSASRQEPAYIQIIWKAHLSMESEIWMRFLNPVTQTLRREVCLGTKLAGEETFTSDDLGFDPASERWAIAVVLRNLEDKTQI